MNLNGEGWRGGRINFRKDLCKLFIFTFLYNINNG